MSQNPKAHILLVDDDEETRQMLTTLVKITSPNYRMTAVESAEEAFNAIRDDSFDLYILDYMLTGITGIEMCARLRQTDRKTPIMLFTAVGDPYVRDQALQSGANAFLRKARDLDALLQTAENLLSKRN